MDGRRPKAADAPVRRPSSTVSDWWRTYFDAGYLREYEPMFDLVGDHKQLIWIASDQCHMGSQSCQFMGCAAAYATAATCHNDALAGVEAGAKN